MRNKLVQKMCFAALLTAIAYVITAFLQIPYAGGAGYFNFGDVFIYLGAVLLGPWYGAFIGVVAGSMADLTGGFINFMPFTVVAKFVMAVAAGYLYKIFPKYVKITALLIGGILMAGVYIIANWVNFGINAAWVPFGFDLLQITLASIVAYALIIPLNKVILKLETKAEEKQTVIENETVNEKKDEE